MSRNEQLYPFDEPPAQDTTLIDIHTGSSFVVRDYLAIREGGLNFLATPRYEEAGGIVLDWLGDTASGMITRIIRKQS